MRVKNSIRAPFVKAVSGNVSLFFDVLVAMLPPMIWAIYVFGARAITVVATAMIFAVVPDFFITRFALKNKKSFDLSPLVTGGLIGFCMPVSVPLWLPAFASLFAICLAKVSSGGIGRNLFNPAATGICASYLFFGDHMTAFTKPFAYFPALKITLDSTMISEHTVVTPLELMRGGKVVTSAIPDYFYGIEAGTIGAVSVIVLLLSLLFLLLRRTVNPGAFIGYIMTFLVLTFFTAYADCEPVDFAMTQLFSGGIALISVFMLSDYSTSPSNMTGKLLYGALCAALTVVIRYFGMIYYGEFFALMVSGMLVPVIEKLTCQRVYGSYIRSGEND